MQIEQAAFLGNVPVSKCFLEVKSHRSWIVGGATKAFAVPNTTWVRVYATECIQSFPMTHLLFSDTNGL